MSAPPPPGDVEASAVKRDIDERFARMSRYPGIIIFPHGITKVQLDKKGKFQGKEYRSIMKVSLLNFSLSCRHSPCSHFFFLLFFFPLQQVVVAFLGYISDEALKAVLSYLRLYKTAKAPQHTLPTLQGLEKEVETYALSLIIIPSNMLLTLFFLLLLSSFRKVYD